MPAFSPRRSADLGIGDTLAMRDWIDWAAEHHIGFIQMLPVQENGADESPYSAISTAALDPVYLACDAPELPMIAAAEVARVRDSLGKLPGDAGIDYRSVRSAKRELLELSWERFDQADDALHAEFDDFRRSEAGWLGDYVVFRFLCDVHGRNVPWDDWPPTRRTPDGARAFIDDLRRKDSGATDQRLGYYAFVQWLCHRQWRAVRAHADLRGVRLFGDIPIGVARHSADVFFQRDQFHLDWCAGSPGEGPGHPDPFTARWGQNWGVPVYRWDHMADDGYRWWRDRLARVTSIFHAFRLDHILGFYRIYGFPWQPADNDRYAHLDGGAVAAHTGGRLPKWLPRPDDTTENQAANLADGDLRLRGLLAGLDAEVIAEDLGWVPPYVRPHLADLGIAGYRIPHWDCDGRGHPMPGAAFPETSFAAWSTHDHDPICAVWRGCLDSIELHRREPGRHDAWQADNARRNLRVLGEFAGIPMPANDAGPWPAYSESVHLRLMKSLMASHSRHVVLMVTEWFGLNERINVPGTCGRHNWRFRMPWSLDAIRSNPAIAGQCAKLSSLIQVTGRGNA